MGCATGIVKFMMFLFNFIFVVGGILMVTAGTIVLTGYSEYQKLVNVDLAAYKAPPIIIIVVGAAVFFIAFMGCCGVLRESNCMMMTYAVFMAIILLIQVGIAVAVTMYEKDFQNVVEDGLVTSVRKYNVQNDIKKAWDTTQQNLKCCGAKKYTDWKEIDFVPTSCCKEQKERCSDGVLNDETAANQRIYTTGCVEKIINDVKIRWVVIAAAVIAGIELLGVMFSCCLAARFRRKNYV